MGPAQCADPPPSMGQASVGPARRVARVGCGSWMLQDVCERYRRPIWLFAMSCYCWTAGQRHCQFRPCVAPASALIRASRLCRVEAAVAEAGVGMLLCGFGVAVSQYGVAHSWPGSLLTVCACVLRPTCRVVHVCTSSWQAASGVSAFMGGSLAPSCLNRSVSNICAPMPHAGLTVASRRQIGSRWPLRRAVRPPRAPKWSTSLSRFINICHTTDRQAGRQAGRHTDRQTETQTLDCKRARTHAHTHTQQVSEGEPIEAALRRFKISCSRSGHLMEVCFTVGGQICGVWVSVHCYAGVCAQRRGWHVSVFAHTARAL